MHTYVYLVLHIFRLFLDALATRSLSDQQKDLEILLLRHQLRILQRANCPTLRHIASPSGHPVWEKGFLAILAVQFRRGSERTGRTLDGALLLFKPDTVQRWHRELVRRKWTFSQDKRTGRTPVRIELEELIVRLAQENPRWGYSKVRGELLKSGHSVSRFSVRNVLKRCDIPPSSQRKQQSSYWRSFLGHYADQMLAADFFTIKTMRLKTLYVRACVPAIPCEY